MNVLKGLKHPSAPLYPLRNLSYNIPMPAERMPQANSPLATALRRLELCTYAVQEIHIELDQPQDPDQKADLILATEKLVAETFDLYQTVRLYVWGEEDAEDEQAETR